MILDNIKNAAFYSGMGEAFGSAFAFLSTVNMDKLPLGKQTQGNVTFSVQEYETLPSEQTRLEGHERYADIQYIVSGQERLGYCARSEKTAGQGYDPEKDIEFFEGDCTLLPMAAGDFAIFFPQDLHQPKCACELPSHVRKIVVKIKL